MLPDDTRSKIKNITTGIVIEGIQDNCTTIRNLLCESFATSTTVKKDFESKAVIKEKQARLLEVYCNENKFWVSVLPGEDRYLTRGGEALVYQFWRKLKDGLFGDSRTASFARPVACALRKTAQYL